MGCLRCAARVALVCCLIGSFGLGRVVAQDDGMVHIVQRGETLYRIAKHYGTTVQVLAALNGITDVSRIRVGQRLMIPATPFTNLVTLSALVGVGMAHAGGATMPQPEQAAAAPAALPDSTLWPLDLGVISDINPAMHEVYLRGQAMGNNPRAFSKIGDCNSEPPFFLFHFDDGQYNLGPYEYLQPTVDYFAGSFARQSVAVWTGNHTWSVFDATWANPAYCKSGESPIACEFRLHRPSVVFIRLGTNDVGQPELFADSLRRIVEFSIERGVIPILGTKADHYEGSDANNAVIRQVAAEYAAPLWDFGAVAATLPGHGLGSDGVHMTWAALDFAGDRALHKGHPVHNLTALIALDAVWRGVMY
ncbi:MAG: LysM peptidoglycan-binding domain-containing protein [Anaerolineae bacterium]|nr:LysM peptidoglycan-binding domain-containing protein [Anaerolineae bacterium]